MLNRASMRFGQHLVSPHAPSYPVKVRSWVNISGRNRVVLNATASADKPHPGLAFMIKSPWSNQLEGDESCPAGASGFKGIQAQVSPSSEGITQMDEILQRLRA